MEPTKPKRRGRKASMTRMEAATTLISTGELTTNLLAPLGISMETFLRLAQLPTETANAQIQALIERCRKLVGSQPTVARTEPTEG